MARVDKLVDFRREGLDPEFWAKLPGTRKVIVDPWIGDDRIILRRYATEQTYGGRLVQRPMVSVWNIMDDSVVGECDFAEAEEIIVTPRNFDLMSKTFTDKLRFFNDLLY